MYCKISDQLRETLLNHMVQTTKGIGAQRAGAHSSEGGGCQE